jgi:nucleotide-binding universal stress UspA family protein
MIPIRHVLCPTDFSASADHALEVAIELAAKLDAKLTLLHVYSLPVSGFGGDFAVLPVQDLDAAARRALDGVLERVHVRHANVDGVVQQGSPASTILAVADACGADLIVMGTHGRRGVAHFLLGSVAERVVRTARVAVLTVRLP